MPKQSRVVLAALSMLPFILPIALAFDLYLPSVPTVAKAMAVTPQQTQLTLSIFLLVFGTGQLIIGPLSDNFGRKKILLISALIFFFGSITCALAQEFSVLLIGRALQAIGASGSQVIAFAMIRDQYDGDNAKTILTLLRTCGALSPIFSPMIGAFMLTTFNWQANFIFLTLYGLMIFLFAWFFLQETVTSKAKSSAKSLIKYFFSTYKDVITHPQFIYFSLCGIAAQAVVFTHSSFSPRFYIDQHHLTEKHFATLFGFNACILFISGLLSAKYFSKIGLMRWTCLAGFVLLVGGVSMLITQSYYSHHYALFLPNLIATTGAGMLAGTSIAGALVPFKHTAGTATALFGCLEFVVSALLGSQIIGNREVITLDAVATYYIGLGVAIFLMYLFIRHYFSKDLVTTS